jgi:hypothetical protein
MKGDEKYLEKKEKLISKKIRVTLRATLLLYYTTNNIYMICYKIHHATHT